jgi:hypothetical protein
MIPHLALMMDERYFLRGKELVPERWAGEWVKMSRIGKRISHLDMGA